MEEVGYDSEFGSELRVQLKHMEDRVNCAEMLRKVYGDGVSARSCNDVKWAKVLLGEFFGGSSSVNVFCPHLAHQF